MRGVVAGAHLDGTARGRNIGFNPNTPEKCDGMRTEPAPSLPSAQARFLIPAAAVAPAPADEAPVL